ncbi:MAG: aliphatic sulfonate ABC transporter substrate-binding protein [Nitrososphaerales archaeon]
MSRRNSVVVAIITSIVIGVFVSIAYVLSSTNVNTFSDNIVRIGYFPNLSHAPVLVGLASGTFEQVLGDEVKLDYKVFNAGPAAIEALFTNQVDITYVGPTPAINGYLRTNGEGLRIIAGAASGGTLFVVRADSGIDSSEDLVGKKLASPQYGNTQDVSLKSYIIEHGLQLAQYGGNVHVLSAKNSDIMTLFLKKEIDGAWVPEPWGTILIRDANGKIFLDERDLWPDGEFATTVLIVNAEFVDKRPDLVKKFLHAHVETTLWIKEHPKEAEEVVNAQLKSLLGKELPMDVVHEAFSRMEVTYSPMKFSLFKFADEAYELGLLERERPDLSDIYYTSLLNEVLKERNLQIIQ